MWQTQWQAQWKVTELELRFMLALQGEYLKNNADPRNMDANSLKKI